MKVLVCGASNQVGAWLVPGLLAAGHRVTGLSRRPRPAWIAPDPGLDWQVADLAAGSPDSGGALEAIVHAAPLDYFPSLLGGRPGVRRALLFGSTSAVTKADSPDPRERALAQALREGEERALAACEDAGVVATVLRPTLIYGAGLDRGLTRVARWLRRCPVVALPGRAAGRRQPVHAADLAAVVIGNLERGAGAGGCYDLPGGETLAYREMLERIAASQDRRLRVIPLPRWAGRAVLGAVRLLPGWRDLNAAMLDRLDRDLVFDATPARRDLGFRPRRFEPDADTWRPPAVAGSKTADGG